jgi:hypothetical protein
MRSAKSMNSLNLLPKQNYLYKTGVLYKTIKSMFDQIQILKQMEHNTKVVGHLTLDINRSECFPNRQ